MISTTMELEFRYKLLKLRRSSLHNDSALGGVKMLKYLKMMEQKVISRYLVHQGMKLAMPDT